MSDLARIGIALDAQLLTLFDEHIERAGYANRSEAFRDLIRDRLIREKTAQPKQDVVGTLTLIYDHHQRNLSDKLTHLQHDHHTTIVSTLHVHLNAHHCLEVLVLRGKAKEIQSLADLLIATKGVQHGQLVVTAAP
ncbi:MAG: nickel-responsive transcriptional regulator NikR [Bryobacter sp.]|nr:nickel-responsive transcriptional regulator NikR [Bryobacter sp.]